MLAQRCALTIIICNLLGLSTATVSEPRDTAPSINTGTFAAQDLDKRAVNCTDLGAAYDESC